MPTHLPIAFVVVLHLKANVVSIADELLAKHTALPIQWASDGFPPEPHQIYLLPPAKYMTLRAGTFQLTDRDPEDKRNRAIDIFLASLAQDWDGYSVGVILSGGVVLAQEPASALIASMPEWVIQRDHTQRVLPPEELAQELGRLIEQAKMGSRKVSDSSLADNEKQTIPGGKAS